MSKRKKMVLQLRPPDLSKLRGVKQAFIDSKSIGSFGSTFTGDELRSCLSLKHGYEVVSNLIDILQKISDAVPDGIRQKVFMNNAIKQIDAHIAEDVFSTLHKFVPFDKQKDTILFGPPVGYCSQGCLNKDMEPQPLTCHNPVISVKHFTMRGILQKEKVTLRCNLCHTNYNLTVYGVKGNFRLYDELQDIIEVTDGVIVDREFFEHYCSLHLHCWTTFEGYAEQFNTLYNKDRRSGLTRKLVSTMYYKGEVENELRRLKRIDIAFSTEYLDPVMDLIDEERKAVVYEHEHTEYCLERGCKELHVADGLWKLVFPICAMRTENVVNGLPLLNYPDQCTNAPKSGHSFCEEHLEVMQREGIPTAPSDFLKYCKQLKGVFTVASSTHNINDITDDTDDSNTRTANIKLEDSDLHKLIDAVVKDQKHNNLAKTGKSAISTHGANKMIASEAKGIQTMLQDSIEDPNPKEPPCQKETGKREGLHMRSRGYFFIITAGGFIETFSPLYRSESPSQAFLIMLTFLYTLLRDQPASEWSKIWLAYDNMCNIERMKIAKLDKLPFPGELSFIWKKVNKMIDSFHIVNHKKDSKCQVDLHPKRFMDSNTHLTCTNSAAAEQCFNWAGRYKRQICAINKRQQMFMLHRLSLRRNAYVSKCHTQKEMPPIPHIK